MRRKVELYRVKENIDLTPKLFINLVSSTLYEHRFGPFFVNPIVVGLDHTDNYKPYIATYDSIGCLTESGEFQVAGTSSELLYGTCEALYKKILNLNNCLRLSRNDWSLLLIEIFYPDGELMSITRSPLNPYFNYNN